eukprot:PhM_4_TR11817/c0_g1_i1/m.40192
MTDVCRLFRRPRTVPLDMEQTLNLNVDLDEPEAPIFKPFVFCTGSDGIEMINDSMLRNDGNVMSALLALGLTANYVRDQIEGKGNCFAMLVVPFSNGLMFPATWDGLFDAMASTNPELIPYIQKFGPEIRSPAFDLSSFPQFAQRYDSVERCEEAHVMDDPGVFLTPRRFMKLDTRDVVDFRVLVWLWFGANLHFSGAGHTLHSETGEVGVSEYLLRNFSLKKFVSDFGATIQDELKIIL